jgi:hypothetical protein
MKTRKDATDQAPGTARLEVDETASLSRRAALAGAGAGVVSAAALFAPDLTPASAQEQFVTTTPATSTRNVVQPTSPSVTPLVVQAAANQSADLLQWQDSTGKVMASVSSAGNFGLGTPPRTNRVTIADKSDGFALWVSANKNGLAVVHSNDLAGEADDLVNLYHKGTGDALFVNHTGGLPPGNPGPAGGNAGFNVMIPYHLDAAGVTGYDGTVVNDRSGMKGLQIYSLPPNPQVYGAAIVHGGQSPAIYIKNQDSAHAQGHGAGLYIDSWSNSAAIVAVSLGGTGNLMTLANSLGWVLTVTASGSVNMSERLSVGVLSPPVLAGAYVEPGSPGEPALAVRALSSQSGNIQEWQDSGGTLLSSISESGYFMTRKTTAPGDAELAAGEMALWLDPSNGAAKMMVKAKQADGTVRTGSLALT